MDRSCYDHSSSSVIVSGSSDKSSVEDYANEDKEYVTNENIDGSEKVTIENIKIIKSCDKKSLAEMLKAEHPVGFVRGMPEKEFRDQAKKVGLSDKICDALVDDVHALVKSLSELSDADKALIREKEDFAAAAKLLPADRSRCLQLKTTISAGSNAYLTSFFLGKLTASLCTIPTNTPHGAWAFLLAGCLNAAISEPVVQGIRSNGSVYGSPDGKAYAEFHTASTWLENTKNDPEEFLRWRKKIASIVTSVLHREQSKKINRLGSGIAKIDFSDDGSPISAKTVDGKSIEPEKAIEKVISRARLRAFITDELPFLCFSFNYVISGAAAPIFKKELSMWGYFFTDLTLSATLGTISGIETATLQNILRSYIQGANIDAQTPEYKRALQSAAYTKRTIYEEKMTRLKQLRQVLIAQLDYLKKNNNPPEYKFNQEIKAVTASLLEARQAYRAAHRQYLAIKRKFNQHNTVHGRAWQAAKASMGTYMGEVGRKPNPAFSESAKFKAISKLIAYPLSLSLNVLWTSVAVPAILDSLYPVVPGLTTLSPQNSNDFSGSDSLMRLAQPDVALWNQNVKNYNFLRADLNVALMEFHGFPLILGFVLRNQFLARGIEWGLVRLFGSRPDAANRASAAEGNHENDAVGDNEGDSSVVSSWKPSDADHSSDDESEIVGEDSSLDNFDSTDSSDDNHGEAATPAQMESGKAGIRTPKADHDKKMLSDDEYTTADEGQKEIDDDENESSIYT